MLALHFRRLSRSAPVWVPALVVLLTLLPARSGFSPFGAPAHAQPPAPPAAAAQPPADPKADQPLAVVNATPITRRDVQRIMAQIELAPGAEIQDAYNMAVEMLVNTELLFQFLNRQGITVTKKDLDDELARLSESLKAQNLTLEQALAANGATMQELQKDLTRAKLWEKYVTRVATEERLKKYVADNQDLFNGVKVTARHILLKVPEGASEEVKASIKAKLLAIKAEIESGKIEFAEAADKYSEDDGNKQQPSGGFLGEFYRRGQLIEEFAEAAFKCKPGVISDPVETEFGYHLILVTNRDEGQPFDFEKGRDIAFQQFESELREEVILAEKAKAKIEKQPMPSDLVPPATSPETAPSPTPASATPASGS